VDDAGQRHDAVQPGPLEHQVVVDREGRVPEPARRVDIGTQLAWPVTAAVEIDQRQMRAESHGETLAGTHMGDGRVVVMGLGGTIAMTSTDTGGVAPSLSPQQLIDA